MTTQTNEKLISGEETQPEEPMIPGGNSRAITPPSFDQVDPDPEVVTHQDFVKNGAVIQESFGSNSTLEVNLCGGRLFLHQHLFTAEGKHMPASFAISYNPKYGNTNTVHNQTVMFQRWKLNYQQFLHFDEDKFVYVDGAFKEHIFEKSTFNNDIYLDTTAQTGTLLRPATGNETTFADHVIFDDAGTQMFFKNNRLIKVTQTNGSTAISTSIAYDGSGRVNKVTDGLGDDYFVNYQGQTITITGPNSSVLATLTANTNGVLQEITYLDGKKCIFTNDVFKRVLHVEDQSTYEKLKLEYDADYLIAVKKFSCKNSQETPLTNSFLYYYPNESYTIVSKNVVPADALSTDFSQIRYKYSFNADGVLLEATEIDLDDEPIGLQPYRPDVDDEENNPIYDVKNKKDLLGGVEVDYSAHSMEGSAKQILSDILTVPSYQGSAYLFLSWDLRINTGEVNVPRGTITFEGFANGRSMGGIECKCAYGTSYSGFCVAKDLMPKTEVTVTLKMTHTGNTFPVTLSNVRAWFAPNVRNEVRINVVPNLIGGIDSTCISETLGSVEQYWFPVAVARYDYTKDEITFDTNFDTNHGRVVPQTFTVDDYQKTMLSYFKDPTNFNLFYNDCKNVVYGVSLLTVGKMAQTFYFEDLPFAVVQTSMTGQTTITHFTPENSKLNIHTRQLNDPLDCAYTKLDSYLRTSSEWSSGSAITTYEYDTFGNVKESYFGGSTGERTTSVYSENGQQVVESPDYMYADTHTTTFAYNTNGMLSGVTTPRGTTVSYTYQNRDVLNRVSSSVDDGANNITSNGAFISSLAHNGTTFQFHYDDRNNISQVTVAGATLLSKSAVYNSDGSFCTQSVYSNQQVAKKYYDKYDRLIKISDVTSAEQVLAKFIYSDEEVATDVTEPTDARLYISNASKLRVVIDTTANTRTVYTYDQFGKLNKVQNQELTTTQTLDEFNRVASIGLIFGGNMATNYTYASPTDNTLVAEETVWDMPGAISTTYTRDNLQRPTTTKVMCGTNGHKYTYSYIPRQTKTWVPIGGGQIIHPGSVGTGTASPYALTGRWQIDDVGATPYVSKFEEYSMSGDTATLVRTDAITYDANGNITKYGNVTYEYDKLNRLVRENNPHTGIDKTITWSYDIGGNIVSRTEYAYTTGTLGTATATYTYTYDNSWKDQLKSFGGQSITYDQAGNPTLYRGATLTWQRGRLLDSFRPSGSSYTTTFKYDANGIRRQKVVPTSSGSSTTTYLYQGSNLIQQVKTGTNPHTITFLYNNQGVIGFVYNSTTYTYRKNLFGDIVSIYNGATKVADYTYDAWGNHVVYDPQTNSYPTNTTFIGNINPFRYRSYYFDTDIGLYYLMSRYYDPQTGRFINADTLDYLEPESINGLNLYAYCGNNPIMYADPGGCFPILACILGLTALVGLGLTIGGVASDNNLMTAIGLTMVAIPALISGGMALACVGAWGTMAIGCVTAIAGVGTGLFASAEYQEAFTGNNWMLDAGMSEGLYNGLMLTTASIATAGTFASLAGVGKYATAANGWGSVIKNGKTISPVQNMRRHFIKHVIKEKRYTLGTNIYAYSNNARILNNTINVWKVSKTSGNLIGRAILNGKNARLIRDVVTGLILSLC